MKFLSIAGTAAMFLVGGGIFTHNVPVLHHAIEAMSKILPAAPWLVSGVLNLVFGVLLGLAVVLVVLLVRKLFKKK